MGWVPHSAGRWNVFGDVYSGDFYSEWGCIIRVFFGFLKLCRGENGVDSTCRREFLMIFFVQALIIVSPCTTTILKWPVTTFLIVFIWIFYLNFEKKFRTWILNLNLEFYFWSRSLNLNVIFKFWIWTLYLNFELESEFKFLI